MASKQSTAGGDLHTLKEKFLQEKAPFLYTSISLQQSKTAVDFPARGSIHVSRDVMAAPADDILVQVVMSIIRDLGDGSEEITVPALQDVKIQWTASRNASSFSKPEPASSENGNYHEMVADTSDKPVIFYAHGGYFCTGSPATSRGFTTAIARSTGGRCFALDHRLCPQNPFPAALVDALLAYLSLLYPRKDNFHQPVQAKDIVFAAESAGGNLLMSLLLTIRQINQKHGGYIKFHNQDVKVPFPAGIACVGCHLDMTISFDFTDANREWDFLLPTPPALSDRMPKCAVWPSKPPRGDLSCEISALCHPLVSPVAARSYKGLPPIFLAYGEEYLGSGEGKYVAQRATNDGISVQFHHYQKMPHCFHILYPTLPQSKHVIEDMGRFMQTCVSDAKALESKNLVYSADHTPLAARDTGLPFTDLRNLPFDRMMQRMRHQQTRRAPWTGPGKESSL